MLSTNSFINRIRQILEGSESGVLLLEHHPEVVRVACREGLIEAVSSNLNRHRLGQYMVREGFIAPSALEAIVPSYLWRFRKTAQFRGRVSSI